MQTATEKPAMTAVDYFRALLTYEITPWTLRPAIEESKVHVVDVRSPESYLAGHIPSAVNIPAAELPGRLSELPKDKTLVVYCSNITCWLSARTALQLAEKGFAVQRLFGGLQEWKEQGFPVETAAPKPTTSKPAAKAKSRR